jgi:hypothetical protein
MTAIHDQEHIRRIMKHVVWDYDVDPYELHEVVLGKRQKVGHFDRKRVFLRMLERLSWYDLLDLLTVDLLRDLLTPETIAGIRRRDVRERYGHIRRVLQDKALPSAGWHPGYREKIRNTLLSDRWYRAEQGKVRA